MQFWSSPMEATAGPNQSPSLSQPTAFTYWLLQIILLISRKQHRSAIRYTFLLKSSENYLVWNARDFWFK